MDTSVWPSDFAMSFDKFTNFEGDLLGTEGRRSLLST